VCHGTCNCGRCKKRGPPGWYGQLKKMKSEDRTDGTYEMTEGILDQSNESCISSMSDDKDPDLELVGLEHHMKSENDDGIMMSIDDVLSVDLGRISQVQSVQSLDSSPFIDEPMPSLLQNLFTDSIDPVFG